MEIAKIAIVSWNPKFNFSSYAYSTKPNITAHVLIDELHIFFLLTCFSGSSRGLKQHASSASTCCMYRMWVILSSYTIITATLYLHTSLKFPTCQCPIVYTRSSPYCLIASLLPIKSRIRWWLSCRYLASLSLWLEVGEAREKRERKLPEPNIYPHLSTLGYAEISENDLTITRLAFF